MRARGDRGWAVIFIHVGAKLFEFTSRQQWIDKGQDWFRPFMAERTLCKDALGRLVFNGADFERAERDDAYPVSVYLSRCP